VRRLLGASREPCVERTKQVQSSGSDMASSASNTTSVCYQLKADKASICAMFSALRGLHSRQRVYVVLRACCAHFVTPFAAVQGIVPLVSSEPPAPGVVRCVARWCIFQEARAPAARAYGGGAFQWRRKVPLTDGLPIRSSLFASCWPMLRTSRPEQRVTKAGLIARLRHSTRGSPERMHPHHTRL
jgi:hypothetical protein